MPRRGPPRLPEGLPETSRIVPTRCHPPRAPKIYQKCSGQVPGMFRPTAPGSPSTCLGAARCLWAYFRVLGCNPDADFAWFLASVCAHQMPEMMVLPPLQSSRAASPLTYTCIHVSMYIAQAGSGVLSGYFDAAGNRRRNSASMLAPPSAEDESWSFGVIDF
jgi:hypothetical protein